MECVDGTGMDVERARRDAEGWRRRGDAVCPGWVAKEGRGTEGGGVEGRVCHFPRDRWGGLA